MQHAMILAAGRGERLRPLTDTCPKALCTVQGIPLIEYHLNNLATAGFKKVVINHAYLGGLIRRQLGDGRRWNLEICYAAEPPGGLETGGGLYNALPLLGNEPFLVVNADIFTDFSFDNISLPPGKMAHLILVQSDFKTGDFGLTADNLVTNANREYTFSGIAVYHPDFFKSFKIGRYSVNTWLRRSADLQELSGELYLGKWQDIGSLERLMMVNTIS